MDITTYALGPAQANCCVLKAGGGVEAVVFDPGQHPEPVLAAVKDTRVCMILLTHGHLDHIAGVAALKEATGARVLIHREEAEFLTDPELNLSAVFPDMGPDPVVGPEPDGLLEDGQKLQWAGPTITCLHTPGHTPGGVSFYIPSEGVVFVGDTLFAGSIGNTEFPGGDYRTLLKSIHTKLLSLDDEVRVYSGHGPATTIGRERATNPFLQEG